MTRAGIEPASERLTRLGQVGGPQVDALFKQGLQTSVYEERKKIYDQILMIT